MGSQEGQDDNSEGGILNRTTYQMDWIFSHHLY